MQFFELNIIFLYFLCNFFNLPLKKYLLNVFNKCTYQKRNYIIFDQLNLHTQSILKKTEIIKIMNQAGFNDVEIFRRHNYSWTIISKK